MKLFRKAAGSAPTSEAAGGHTRRTWIHRFGVGTLLTGITGLGYAFVRSLVPNVLYEEPQRFKAGTLDQFPEGATFLEDRRVYIVRENRTYHAISAVCTHLGCTVKMVNLNQPQQVRIAGRPATETREFHCPCHGSKYYGDGTNYAGPAPKPLSCFRLEVAAEDGQLVVNLDEPVSGNFRLTV
jgi:menaquinol-cytochrome c reductase iron-sulfur subunit